MSIIRYRPYVYEKGNQKEPYSLGLGVLTPTRFGVKDNITTSLQVTLYTFIGEKGEGGKGEESGKLSPPPNVLYGLVPAPD